MTLRKFTLRAALVWALAALPHLSPACTSLLVTKGASADGSNMLTYSADSYQLFGELYHYPAAT